MKEDKIIEILNKLIDDLNVPCVSMAEARRIKQERIEQTAIEINSLSTEPVTDKKITYKVLVGDPFGGYATFESGLIKKEAEKLSEEISRESDYFTTTMIKPD